MIWRYIGSLTHSYCYAHDSSSHQVVMKHVLDIKWCAYKDVMENVITKLILNACNNFMIVAHTNIYIAYTIKHKPPHHKPTVPLTQFHSNHS